MSGEVYLVEIDRIVLTGAAVTADPGVLGPAVETAVARELAHSPLPAGTTMRTSVTSTASAGADPASMVARGVADAVGRGRTRG